jgi:hypothetical protein
MKMYESGSRREKALRECFAWAVAWKKEDEPQGHGRRQPSDPRSPDIKCMIDEM